MRRPRCWLLAAAVAALLGSACHDIGDVKVASLTFRGVHAFDEARLKNVLATHESGWLPWSRRVYFDRAEFDTDLKRLTSFYADRGYPHTRVTSVDVDLSQDRKSVRLTIAIEEGQPTVIDRVILTGFDALPAAAQARFTAQSTIRAGVPRDREQLAATRDTARHFFRESGYAYATVEMQETDGAEADHVVIELTATPGPAATFGPIEVQGLKKVSRRLVDRSITFSPGEPYRESLVLRSQRKIASLQVFDFVHVKTEPPAGEQPLTIPTLVTVTEATPRRLEVGLGYGTEDRVRASLQWRHLNLGGSGQQFAALAKWSSTLSGLSTTYTIPYPFRMATSAEIKGNLWRTHAPTYDAQSYGGVFSAVHRFMTTNGPHRRESRDIVLRSSYRNEFQRYALTAAAARDLSGFTERIALGLDPITGRGSGTVASLGAAIDYAAVNRALDPTSGYAGALHFEHAAPWLGGTFRFDELRVEARGYRPIGATVAAVRLLVGTITATSVQAVPISTRYFLGGTNSLRGWGRYEVAPLSATGLPIGGRSELVISTELRYPIHGPLGGAVFLDAGNVGSGAGALRAGGLRYAAGPGLRWGSPVGVVRGDLGWQLTPIAGLVVNGVPSTRRWRIQISLGQAF